MADQPADGSENFNRLNGAYQRALHMLSPEQRTELRSARPDAPDYAPPAPEGAQWAPGTRLEVDDDGQLVEYRPPQPQNPNATNYGAANPWSDPRPRKDDEERTESGWPT